jgi:hypothetical protein
MKKLVKANWSYNLNFVFKGQVFMCLLSWKRLIESQRWMSYANSLKKNQYLKCFALCSNNYLLSQLKIG